MRRNFDIPVADIGTQTGDGRVIAREALYADNGPWPVQWSREDWGMHMGAVELTGAIESFEIGDSEVRARGFVDDDDANVAELIGMGAAGTPLGVSIDLDDVAVDVVVMDTDDDDDGAEDGVAIVASGGGRVIGSARLDRYDFRLGHRAFTRAGAHTAAAGDPDPGDNEGVLLFSWSTDEIVERLTRGGLRGFTIVNHGAFARPRFAVDDGATEPAEDEPETPEDGDAQAASAGSSCGCGGSCGSCGDGHRSGPAEARRHPRALTATAVAEPMPAELVAEIEQALSGVIEAPMLPPIAWTRNPQLRELTPITYTDDGRVFGHVAPWGQCHTGSPDGQCITTPRGDGTYSMFRTGILRVAEGQDVPVGQITLGGGHADIRLSYRGAIAHYDNVSTAVADVVAGDDAFGVWVAGALRPGLSAAQVRALRGASPSGDWRGVRGMSEMIAVHAVNAPGYPIARVASGHVEAVVAAGAQVMRRLADAVRDDRADPALAAMIRELYSAHTADARAALRAAGRAPGVAALRAAAAGPARSRLRDLARS